GQKGRTISVTPNASTMYTLEVDRGKKIDRDTIHVTVLESPTPDIFGHVKVYERQINYSYYTPFNDSSTYEWRITGNGKLSSTNGGSSILVDFKEPGYAYLTVTETNKYGCKKDTTITIRIYRMTDIADSEIDSEGLNIYPNPMNEFGSVMVKAFIPPSSYASLSIVDMFGKNLITSELDGQNAYREIHVPISTEFLVNGIYMIQLRMDGNVISKKLIINR
ncbi:MAG: T9SS type A sorting domain-containing protein, partial [Ignavibacteria bacterium]